ncbi:MAG: hypothetical protein NVS1B4_03650 [Gemmatimonadaceae bacterium]
MRDTRVPGAAGESTELSVPITGDAIELPRLLLIAAPRDGCVSVREWIGGAGQQTRSVTPRDLYAEIEGASRAGRRVSEELYRVRRWLDLTS